MRTVNPCTKSVIRDLWPTDATVRTRDKLALKLRVSPWLLQQLWMPHIV